MKKKKKKREAMNNSFSLQSISNGVSNGPAALIETSQ